MELRIIDISLYFQIRVYLCCHQQEVVFKLSVKYAEFNYVPSKRESGWKLGQCMATGEDRWPGGKSELKGFDLVGYQLSTVLT